MEKHGKSVGVHAGNAAIAHEGTRISEGIGWELELELELKTRSSTYTRTNIHAFPNTSRGSRERTGECARKSRDRGGEGLLRCRAPQGRCGVRPGPCRHRTGACAVSGTRRRTTTATATATAAATTTTTTRCFRNYTRV